MILSRFCFRFRSLRCTGLFLWLLVSFCTLTACERNSGADASPEQLRFRYGRSEADEEQTAEGIALAAEPPPAIEVSPEPDAFRPDHLVIRTARIRCQLKEYQEGLRQIRERAKALEAEITAENEARQPGSRETTFTIRVPAARFEQLIAQVLELSSYVDFKQINATDVTEEYVDREARLRTRKALEERYLQLLQRANRMEDIVAIENQLRLIREEIESAEARLKYLRQQVARSTLDLTVYEPQRHLPAPAGSFWSQIAEALAGGWHVFLGFLLGLLQLWPFLLLLALLTGVLLRWRKRKKI